MRPVLLVVLCVLALAIGEAARAAESHVDNPAQRVLLHRNDRFGIGGSLIGCRVVARSRRVSYRLHCFVQTKTDSFLPRVGSYEVELEARGVTVVRVGKKTDKVVFSVHETPPKGVPAGGHQAVASFGRVVHLQNHFDKVFLITTNIVCRPYGSKAPLGLLCVLLGSDGHIHDGTYLVLLTQRSVSVALAKNGKSAQVFGRAHGR